MKKELGSAQDTRTQLIADAFVKSIEVSLESIDFDVKCIDWFSYNPDFHIKGYNKKVA
ncbi:MAG: hypothetical protein ABFS18_07980 [Thermodesulfobacteriota bacterium]